MARKIDFVQHDGTKKMLTTPRQEGTFLYFTGKGDDLANGIVGKGNRLIIENLNGDTELFMECSFLDNVFLKDGMAFWENAVFGDSVDMEIVLPANLPMPAEGSNGNAGVIDEQGTISYITASQTPDETWVGDFFLFPMDYVVHRFVNEFPLNGSNNIGTILESSDTAEIEKIFKFRITMHSPSGNMALKLYVMLELYRERTT